MIEKLFKLLLDALTDGKIIVTEAVEFSFFFATKD